MPWTFNCKGFQPQERLEIDKDVTMLLIVALIIMSVFFRTTLHHSTVDDGGLYLGELYFSMVILLFNGFTEVPMLVAKLQVIYKHRDLHFYPSNEWLDMYDVSLDSMFEVWTVETGFLDMVLMLSLPCTPPPFTIDKHHSPPLSFEGSGKGGKG
ncbi:hypothetical protein CTI12_AA505450 [Artemisia annua]|uniref:ABC-2 type transporter transmembrane domain-containing protein n=1 Tax=Artemisia annua TaxID=35608 RepID=A0A2U1LCP6_ARTAN|nr:hypothetical protein CTI12_AA505450 [Artemisia annua]